MSNQAEQTRAPVRRALVALLALALLGLIVWSAITFVFPSKRAELDLIVVPPAQTDLPLMRLSDGGRLIRNIPTRIAATEGSHVLMRDTGVSGLNLLINDEPVPSFEDVDGTLWRVVELHADTNLILQSNDEAVAAVRFDVSPDSPPHVEWASPVQITSRALVRLAVSASDDFGLQALKVKIAPVSGDGPTETVLLTMPPAPRSYDAITYLDLRDHRLAGTDVEITISAEDGVGQIAETEPRQTRLLKRRYRSADAAVLARQNDKLRKSPSYTNDVAVLLRKLAEVYGKKTDDYGLALGFAVAYRQLTGLSLNSPPPRYRLIPASEDVIDSTMPLLNDLAGRMEDRRLADTQEQWFATLRVFDALLAPGADERALRAAHWQLRRTLAAHLGALFVDSLRHNRSFLLSVQRKGGKPHMPALIENALHQLHLDTTHHAWEIARHRLDAIEDVIENSQSGLAVSAKSSPLYAIHQMSAALGALEQFETDLQRGAEKSEPGARPGSPIGDTDAATRARQLAKILRPLAQTDTREAISAAVTALDRAAEQLENNNRGDAVFAVQNAQKRVLSVIYRLMNDRLIAVPGSVQMVDTAPDAPQITDAVYQRLRQLIANIPMANTQTLKHDFLAGLARMEIIAPEAQP